MIAINDYASSNLQNEYMYCDDVPDKRLILDTKKTFIGGEADNVPKTKKEKKEFMLHCVDKNESELFDLINLSNWNGARTAVDKI